MNEIKESNFDQKPEFKKIEQNRNLTLFEHRFIGGSEDINGKRYDSFSLEEDVTANNGIIPDEYFSPIAIVRDGEEVGIVNSIRQNEYIRGMLPFLGEAAMDIYDTGYRDTVMKLPQVDPKTKLTDRKWVLFLIDNKGDVSFNAEILGKITPQGKLKDLLNFELKEDGLHITTIN